MRRDEVTDGKCRDQLLSIATKTVEEYYVAPPGDSSICMSELLMFPLHLSLKLTLDLICTYMQWQCCSYGDSLVPIESIYTETNVCVYGDI